MERAIRLVQSTPEWRARVVYGDTDRYSASLSFNKEKREREKGRLHAFSVVTMDSIAPGDILAEEIRLHLYPLKQNLLSCLRW